MIEVLQREFIYLWYYFDLQLRQIFGYWVFGILVGSTISVFGKQKINRAFESIRGKRLGVLGIIPASAIGIASPLCMYGTIPIAASFSHKGMKDDWLAAYMMSSILLNPQLIIYSAALGATAVFLRVFICFACGIVAGLCVHFFYRDRDYFNFDSFTEPPASRDVDPNVFLRLARNIGRNIRATGPYFLLGVALAAVFQRYVPETAMVNVFGGNQYLGIFMAATIGVPLYACGGGTIPLLQGWLASGMTMGSATAFMITGPATKITNLGAMKIVLGRGRFTLYILFSWIFAFASGILIDLVL